MKPDDLARLSPIASWRLPEADADPQETREWLDAFDSLIESDGRERATYLLRNCSTKPARAACSCRRC